MDWGNLADKFGLPGLMIVLFAWSFVNVGKLWIASNERIQGDRIKVEDKKADAFTSALSSLSGEMRAHHTVEMQNHTTLTGHIAEIRGSVSEALAWQDRTPVESPVPRMRRSESSVSDPAKGYYPPRKPPREE